MTAAWAGVVAGVALAAAPGPVKQPRAAPAAAAPVLQSPAPPAVRTPAPAPELDADPDRALAQLQSLYRELSFDEVSAGAKSLLAREGLPLEVQLEAYRLLGSAQAVIEDAFAAEGAFRLLLRARPDYDLPADTSPKIVASFRKVQLEERKLSEKLAEVQRRRTVESIAILGEVPLRAAGGAPLRFDLRVRDPGGAVDGVEVPYRRRGTPTFSVLALERNAEGRWVGALPGEVTASDAPYALEVAVETRDRAGVLATLGDRSRPLVVEISAGRPRVRPPAPRGLFFAGLGLTAAAGAAAGGLGLGFVSTQAEYRRAAGAEGAQAAELKPIAQRGDALATAATAALITAGAAAVITLVLIPLTDWAGEPAPAVR